MIKCEVTTRNFEADDKVKEYVEDKIGGLERFLPRAARQAVICNIILEDDPNGREDNHYVCEAVLKAPGATMVSREGTINMYAAIDIVEAKLKSQVCEYKERHALEPRRKRMLGRLMGRRQAEGAPELAEAEAPEPTSESEVA